MSDVDDKIENSKWTPILGVLFLAFCISLPFGAMGYLGDDYGAICIGILLLVILAVAIAWVAKVVRAGVNVIERNDPKSPRYRG